MLLLLLLLLLLMMMGWGREGQYHMGQDMGGSGREPPNIAHRSNAEPCERPAHDVSTIRIGDDRQGQLEQARHRVVRDQAIGRARLVRDRATLATALYAMFTLTN